MTGRENQNDLAASRQGAGTHTPATARLGFQFVTFLLGLMLILAALGYGGFGDRLAHSQAANETPVFGPKTYTRTTGKPRPVVDTFAVANPAGDFTLIVRNGKEDGTQRVTSAVILLNGQLIVGPQEFNPKVAVIRKAVSLQAQNTLSVEVRGKPGSLITVSIVGGPLNLPPVANAGADQTVKVGDKVTLNGSGSSDTDGAPLTYRWSLAKVPTGSAATLSDATVVKPTLVVDKPGTYTVELVVNDGHEDSTPDTVIISTINSAPVADAGPDQSVVLGETVTLDGSKSRDADNDPLTYRWTLDTVPDGSKATLKHSTTAAPSFTVDKAGIYT